VTELLLTGLDGANPLAFLAALGVLEAVTDRDPGCTLAWRDAGTWHPILSSIAGSVDTLVAWLEADRVARAGDPALALTYDGKRDLKPLPASFRAYLEDIVSHTTHEASGTARRSADWAASFATDVVTDNNGNAKPTALHFTAGQQQFLAMARDLYEAVTPADLEEALFGPWKYTRPLPVMGWDATAARDYALRASDPSGDKKQGVPGADLLAIRGLASLPVAPIDTRLHTTCCTGGWKTGRFRWPLWTAPLRRDTTRSLLRQDLALDAMSAPERAARGIPIVFSCGIKRSDQGGYGSFEPATVE
jgi:hypothetical protein